MRTLTFKKKKKGKFKQYHLKAGNFTSPIVSDVKPNSVDYIKIKYIEVEFSFKFQACSYRVGQGGYI